MDHISTQGHVFVFQCGMVHRPFSMCDEHSGCQSRQSTRNWEPLKNLLARDAQVTSASTREEGWKICSFGIPHGPLPPQHSELENHLQTYKGADVLQGSNARDDSGYRAVFHGARRITLASGSGHISWCNFQTSWYGRRRKRRGLCAHSSAHVGSSQVAEIDGENMPTSADVPATLSKTEHWDTIEQPVVRSS